jgi:hypothetical protein
MKQCTVYALVSSPQLILHTHTHQHTHSLTHTHCPSHCQATPFRLFKTSADDTEHVAEMPCVNTHSGCLFVASVITYKNTSDGKMKSSTDELQAIMAHHTQTCQYAKCAPCDVTRADFRSHIMAACTTAGCSNLDCHRIKVIISRLRSRAHSLFAFRVVCVCLYTTADC